MPPAALPGSFILGGDFNFALQSEIDRSTRTDTSHNQSRKKLLQYKEFNLVHIWRGRHPDWLTFSCYLSTCQTFSRSDSYLISGSLVSIISKCWDNSSIILDHASV